MSFELESPIYGFRRRLASISKNLCPYLVAKRACQVIAASLVSLRVIQVKILLG